MSTVDPYPSAISSQILLVNGSYMDLTNNISVDGKNKKLSSSFFIFVNPSSRNKPVGFTFLGVQIRSAFEIVLPGVTSVIRSKVPLRRVSFLTLSFMRSSGREATT